MSCHRLYPAVMHTTARQGGEQHVPCLLYTSTCTIQRIGGSEETRRFLANLGFVQGAEVTVLSAIGGNVIVNIKDSRVAINKDMARHIMV